MKPIILLFFVSNNLFAQTYGNPQSNRGPDHGSAKNFGVSEWKGAASVGSEIEVNGKIYSYIRTSKDDFKLSQKTGEKFVDIVPKLRTGSFGAMDEYSRLLNVYEDNKVINIYSWGVQGYHFLFYQKRVGVEPRLIRCGFIKNINHTYFAFDQSIQSIEFNGATQMKVSTIPAVEDGKKRHYGFKRPGVYEFRPDGVYLDGVFDPSVSDREPEDVVNENLQKDPQHYLKKQGLHAERVASWNKELMDEEAARVAAMPPQPTLKPSVNPKPPEPKPEPTVAPSPIPKTPAATTEPESTLNFTPWLAGLVALLVMLLGYFGLRYFRKSARS